MRNENNPSYGVNTSTVVIPSAREKAGKGIAKRSGSTIVMTGGTSGIGACALEKLAEARNTQIFLGARGKNRHVPMGVSVLPLDLSSLTSVRNFADKLTRQLGDQDIDVLILNAGMQSGTNEKKSSDGWELTFAVNHLAHYHLVRLLLPYLAKEAKIVLTTSDTHDPKVTPIAPKSFELEEWASPTKNGFGTGIRAYAASKLCNLMTAERLRREQEIIGNKVEVIAFNPGFTGGTSLGRDSSAFSKVIVKILMNTVFRVVSWFKPEYRIGKPEVAGAQLAEVALGTLKLPAGKSYISLVDGQPTFPSPSELALDIKKQEELWNKSEKMIQQK